MKQLRQQFRHNVYKPAYFTGIENSYTNLILSTTLKKKPTKQTSKTTTHYQRTHQERTMSVSVSAVVKKAKTIQYIIHFTCKRAVT